MDPRLPEKVENLADEANEEATVGVGLSLHGEETRFSSSNVEHIREDQDWFVICLPSTTTLLLM